MLEWWQRIVGRQPLPDGPRKRYELQRRLGATPADALRTVASSYGLTSEIRWTIADLDRLLFWQWMYRQKRLTDD